MTLISNKFFNESSFLKNLKNLNLRKSKFKNEIINSILLKFLAFAKNSRIF